MRAGCFILVFLCTFSCSVAADELDGLLSLYDAFDGDQWTNNTNWNTDQPCSFYGITCNINGESIYNVVERAKDVQNRVFFTKS
jgi:hypothetical protein